MSNESKSDDFIDDQSPIRKSRLVRVVAVTPNSDENERSLSLEDKLIKEVIVKKITQPFNTLNRFQIETEYSQESPRNAAVSEHYYENKMTEVKCPTI
jgi:hypothetical protein